MSQPINQAKIRGLKKTKSHLTQLGAMLSPSSSVQLDNELALEICSEEPIADDLLAFELGETITSDRKMMLISEEKFGKFENYKLSNSIGFVISKESLPMKNDPDKKLTIVNARLFSPVFKEVLALGNITKCYVDWEYSAKTDSFTDRLKGKLSQRKLIIHGLYIVVNNNPS